MKLIYFIFFVMSFGSCACDNDINAVSKCFLDAIIQQDVAKLKSIYNNDDFDSSIFFGDIAQLNSGLKTVHAVLNSGDILINIAENPEKDGGSYIVSYYPKSLAQTYSELVMKEKSGEAKMFVNYIVCEIDVNSSGASMPHPCFFGIDFNEF